jgi:hypothetical protein
VYEVVRRHTENTYSNGAFISSGVAGYVFTGLYRVTGCRSGLTRYDVRIVDRYTDISEEPNASSCVIEQKIGLKELLRNIGACLSDYTSAGPRRP